MSIIIQERNVSGQKFGTASSKRKVSVYHEPKVGNNLINKLTFTNFSRFKFKQTTFIKNVTFDFVVILSKI